MAKKDQQQSEKNGETKQEPNPLQFYVKFYKARARTELI
jgi:hypothetical protein